MLFLISLFACADPPAEAPAPTAAPAPAAASAPAAAHHGNPLARAAHSDRLRGICDGSAAVRLPDEALLVAYDEDTALHRFGPGGAPQADAPLHGLLGTTDGPEYDLEAAALAPATADQPARIWWAGSHGRDGDDQLAPARHTFFATNVPVRPDLSDLAVLNPSIDLMPLWMADPAVAARFHTEALQRGSKAGGVNLEAMATHPDGGLVFGFRGPLSADDGLSGTALLIHMNPSEAGWTVAGTHEVDLGNRGFRDLVADADGWRVVAGPVDDGEFALYHLDAAFQATPWPADLGKLRPEAIVADKDGWLLLSDDGKVKRPDSTAKDGDRGCDKVRKEHGRGHPEVYLRTHWLPAQD